jgi:hypothetical protein
LNSIGAKPRAGSPNATTPACVGHPHLERDPVADRELAGQSPVGQALATLDQGQEAGRVGRD